MRRSYARRIDANQTSIKQYLESHGIEVIDCSSVGSVPDLLCINRKQMAAWIEVKVAKKALFTFKQLEWMSKSMFAVRIVDNKEDALDFALTHNGKLTQDQKDRLAWFCKNNPSWSKLFTPKQVEDILNAD